MATWTGIRISTTRRRGSHHHHFGPVATHPPVEMPGGVLHFGEAKAPGTLVCQIAGQRLTS